MSNNCFSLYNRIESYIGRLATLFVSSDNDLIKSSRLSCLYLMLIQSLRLLNDKGIKQLEISYQDYEKGINLRDQNSEFGFLKPFFKEIFTVSICLSQKCRLRSFLYSFSITGEYYSDKLTDLQGGFYTQFFHLICFSFYRTKPNIWPALNHFTTQNVAKFKSQSERFEFSVIVLIRFLNCYTKSDRVQEGNAESLKTYFLYLGQLLTNAIERNSFKTKSTLDLENLKLLKFKFNYTVDFHEEQISKVLNRNKLKKIDQSEFVEVLEKHVQTETLKTCPDFAELLETIYCDEPSEKRAILCDKIRDAFVDENICFVLFANNPFKVF